MNLNYKSRNGEKSHAFMGLIGAIAGLIAVATLILYFVSINQKKAVSGSVLRGGRPIPNLAGSVEGQHGTVVVRVDDLGKFSLPRISRGRVIEFWEGEKKIFRGIVPRINEGLFDIKL